MNRKLVGVIALMSMVFASCGGGSSDAVGPTEEIGVEGAWTIDVLNEDGSLDQHIEFHNAFVGADMLAEVLAGTQTIESWFIWLSQGSAPQICSGTNGQCKLVATATRDPSTSEFVLEATAVPDFDGEIVESYVALDLNPGGIPAIFSTKDHTPIAVKAGQTVQVEIRYSFGTAP